MNLLIPSFLVLGSYSIGYGLARIGFPSVQNKTILEKVAIGYLGGMILFGLAFVLLLLFELDIIYYPVTTTLIFLVMGLGLFIKRIILNETDPIINIPQKYSSPNKNNFEMNYQSIKQKPFQSNKKNNSTKIIDSTEELMVKTRNKENNNNKNQQKENIMTQLREYAQEIKLNKNKTKKSKEIEENEELMELEEYDF